MPTRYNTILIFGAPGSGKGTQGLTLGKIPGFFHCACGDVFRSIDLSTPLGQTFLEYSSRGELVPDETTVQLWKVRIKSSVESRSFHPDIDHLILDGIPRNEHQARLMDNLIQVRCVFHLACPDRDQLVSRLKRRALRDNRLDDANESVIRKRLETYDAESKPILDYYGPDLVRHVDATQAPVKVLHELTALILNML